jgi:hypothetical protein
MSARLSLALGIVVGVAVTAAVGQGPKTPSRLVINQNATPVPRTIPAGQAVAVFGPDEGPGVDHVRVTLHGYGIDPIFGCDFASGTMARPAAAQNRETLCTFQGRGYDGRGYAKSTMQFRPVTCEDWTPARKCTHVVLSTTRQGTTQEYVKVNWSDGGHIEYGNALPALTGGCGTGATITGSDNGFSVIVGRGAGEACQVRFHSPWVLAYSRQPYEPVCVANNQSRAALVSAVAVTSRTLAIRGDFRPGDGIAVVCVGRHDWPAQS